MSGIFKKAISLFAQSGEGRATSAIREGRHRNTMPQGHAPAHISLSTEDIDRFDKHFEQMFDNANLPGPDYYEFWKMTEALAVHVRDERSRIAATFASLSIQGLTQERLVETAQQYKGLINDDRSRFGKACDAMIRKIDDDIHKIQTTLYRA